MPLQRSGVGVEDVRHFALRRRQRPGDLFLQQRNSLAEGGQRRLQLVRDMAQRLFPLGLEFAEAYPQLQASQNFLQLQQSVVDTEDKIQASRRFYNGGVRELNTKIKVFPNNMFARSLGFHEREFFEVTGGAAIAEPPRIQF